MKGASKLRVRAPTALMHRGASGTNTRGSILALQGQGVRTTMTASPGGSVTVNVAPNDPSVDLTNNSTGDTQTIPVAPGKDTTVPIPNVPGGTLLFIRVGTGLRARIITVEVIAPGP